MKGRYSNPALFPTLVVAEIGDQQAIGERGRLSAKPDQALAGHSSCGLLRMATIVEFANGVLGGTQPGHDPGCHGPKDAGPDDGQGVSTPSASAQKGSCP